MAQIELYANTFLSALLYLQSNLTPFALALYLCHSHSISSTDYKQDGKFLDPFTLQFVFDALLLFGNFMIFSVCVFSRSLSLSLHSVRSVSSLLIEQAFIEFSLA